MPCSGSPASAGMVPSSTSFRRRRRRFPRVRGDGPNEINQDPRFDEVPPRPRGWSRRAASALARFRGSPASAGMVPAYVPQSLPPAGFPRVRGDGPTWSTDRHRESRVPPRPRGWSPGQARILRPIRGSPASAGMVPRREQDPRKGRRFPRVRGDGPYAATSRRRIAAVPPRPRGWSHIIFYRAILSSGSPASAGMVPGTAATGNLWDRFPRVRGDGPLRAVVQGESTIGSPASAGMVPRPALGFLPRGRFPRVRGDGPYTTPTIVPLRVVPPRPRGWSRASDNKPASAEGSPASAGMVPAMSPRIRDPTGFPRVRGDGPRSPEQLECLRKVPPRPRGWSPKPPELVKSRRGSPASAGMVPLSTKAVYWPVRFPRVRGDGPRVSARPSKTRLVPPRPRGWSLFTRQRHNDGAGSPASAGMVPLCRARNVAAHGFPRVRGDGPRRCCVDIVRHPVPPRPRGWSRAGGGRRRLHAGSPASAGMVPPWCPQQD